MVVANLQLIRVRDQKFFTVADPKVSAFTVENPNFLLVPFLGKIFIPNFENFLTISFHVYLQ